MEKLNMKSLAEYLYTICNNTAKSRPDDVLINGEQTLDAEATVQSIDECIVQTAPKLAKDIKSHIQFRGKFVELLNSEKPSINEPSYKAFEALHLAMEILLDYHE